MCCPVPAFDAFQKSKGIQLMFEVSDIFYCRMSACSEKKSYSMHVVSKQAKTQNSRGLSLSLSYMIYCF